jgi:hypothetical protein
MLLARSPPPTPRETEWKANPPIRRKRGLTLRKRPGEHGEFNSWV